MKWYIGQKVVAVKGHAQGFFKKGDEFEIKGLKQGCCEMAKVWVDIGHLTNRGFIGCPRCNHTELSATRWYSEKMFAPLETKSELSEHTDETIIKELERELVTL